jgi:hypothetical protein
MFAHLQECGEARNFPVSQTHLARPAATGRAALTFIKNRHATNYPPARRTTTFELNEFVERLSFSHAENQFVFAARLA